MGDMRRFNHVRILDFKLSSGGPDLERRVVPGWASTPEVDSYEEVILPAAYTDGLPEFMRNPVAYWNHDYRNVPIGKILSAEVQPAGLWVEMQFGTTPLAQEVWTAVAVDGTVRSMSVGFWADYTPEYGYFDKDRGLWVWSKVNLIEVSVCGLPANTGAQFQLARSLGIPTISGVRSLGLEVRGVSSTPLDRGAACAALQEWAGEDPRCLSRVFLWEKQLPVAEMAKDGVPVLSWPAVADSATTLLGAKGGVPGMPEEDRAQAMQVLRQCYAKFGKKPPTWRGAWPAALRDVTFYEGELSLTEQTVALANAKAVIGGSQAMADIVRHWESTPGGGPSASMADPALRSISQLASVLEALPSLPEGSAEQLSKAADALQRLSGRSSTTTGSGLIRVTRG